MTHGHGHTEDLDWDTQVAQLERGAELSAPYLRDAASWLTELAPARVERVLDVGSGPGVMSCLLAETFPSAEVVAVDAGASLLDRVAARAGGRGLGGRVVTRQAELPDGLDDLGEADLVWSSHVLHHLGDQQQALTRLAARLRPGGLLALAEGGLPMRFLPRDIGFGRPGLQARLDVAQEEWFTAMRASLPGSVPVVEDWPALLEHSGLTHLGTGSFLTDLPAPASTEVREYLYGTLERYREHLGESLDADDVATIDRLLDRDVPEGLIHRRDVFLLDVSTLHVARAG